MFSRFALGALLLMGTTAIADDKKDDTTTKVTGKVIIAKDVGSFAKRTLELRLYGYDPRIADKAADLIDTFEVKDFAHEEGKETTKEFTIGAKGALKPNTKYYVTAFVLDGKKRTHIGQADHVKEPFNKVITDGNPRDITLRFREVGKK